MVRQFEIWISPRGKLGAQCNVGCLQSADQNLESRWSITKRIRSAADSTYDQRCP